MSNQPMKIKSCKPLYTNQDKESKMKEFFEEWVKENEEIYQALCHAIDKSIENYKLLPTYQKKNSVENVCQSLRNLPEEYMDSKWDDYRNELEHKNYY